MKHHHGDSAICAVTGKRHPLSELLPLSSLRPQVLDWLHLDLALIEDIDSHWVSREKVNEARINYARDLLTKQLGELGELDEEVLQSLRQHEILSESPEEDEQVQTFGNRVADKIASFGGSWRFILSFCGFLVAWIILNAWFLASKTFDPYPFILLNLLLSCLASLQAPIIMMSQNRQESRDRKRAENDYKINLKAELEIRQLNEKIDFLLHQQNSRHLELQQLQLDMMRELTSRPQS